MYNNNMKNIIPISEARSKLPKLVEDADVISQKTLITVGGKVKAALISARELELLEDTLEILSDPQAMKAIKKGKLEIKEGKLTDWEDLKRELNL
jgi:antitoxin YefM